MLNFFYHKKKGCTNRGFYVPSGKRNFDEKQYFCNPLNMDYRYQFIQDMRSGEDKISREAADPSMILFQGKYYIFASMTLSVWVSEDMVHWESHRLPESLPLYDYAPDVRVVGDYVYFSASRRGTICDFYRTKDILNGPFERIPGTFDFWDPNLFLDDDGKLYFYWGCNNVTPIWGRRARQRDNGAEDRADRADLRKSGKNRI